MVVGRLKPCMSHLVFPLQIGFVLGRTIHENIIVAKEIMHSMQKKKGKKGFFAIKIDLTKAYDKLNWEFIWHILEEIEIPKDMVNVIMHGVTSVETNINWNGSKNDFFRPQRGIGQGDPMSPYIFALCMDKLMHLIEQAINRKKWKPFNIGKSGVGISYLMLADNLFIFGEASQGQLRCVKGTLENFRRMSDEEISNDKSSILFSDNVSRNTRNKLVHIFGFRETQCFGKYLGIPLKGKSMRRHDYQYVIDQVANKLSNRKARHLSFMGRVTLAKSVIEAIPIYPMMTYYLPKSMILDIHKLQRDFVWGILT